MDVKEGDAKFDVKTLLVDIIDLFDKYVILYFTYIFTYTL